MENPDIMTFTIGGVKIWMDMKEYQRQHDFFNMSREDFWKKYPEAKPIFNNRVLIDEADKRPR